MSAPDPTSNPPPHSTAPPGAARRAPSVAARLFWPIVLLTAAATLAAHVPSLSRAHFEGDEVIFTFLAERLRSEPLRYSIQGPLEGTAAQRFIAESWQPAIRFQADDLARFDRGRAERLRAYADWLAGLKQAEVLYAPPRRSPDGTPDDPRRPAYDPEVYNRPFFFHPPVVPYVLAASRAVFGAAGAPLIALLAHGAAIVLVGLIGRRLGGATCGILAAILIAVDPITWLCANRVWIDGPLQTTLCLAVLAALVAAERGGWTRYAAAGLCFGIAVLTKFPALLAAPALIAAAYAGPRRARPVESIAAVGGALLLIGPWLMLTKANYGVFLPAAHPTPWLMENFPYVRMLVERPVYFYFFALCCVAPVYGVVLLAAFAIAAWKRWARPTLRGSAAGTSRFPQAPQLPPASLPSQAPLLPYASLLPRASALPHSSRLAIAVPATWAICVIGALLVMGAQKWGYQLRYLAPAMPALCLLTAYALSRAPRWTWVPAGALAAVGLASGVMSVSPPPIAEPRPYLLEAALVQRLPVPPDSDALHRKWPRMW